MLSAVIIYICQSQGTIRWFTFELSKYELSFNDHILMLMMFECGSCFYGYWKKAKSETLWKKMQWRCDVAVEFCFYHNVSTNQSKFK